MCVRVATVTTSLHYNTVHMYNTYCELKTKFLAIMIDEHFIDLLFLSSGTQPNEEIDQPQELQIVTIN